MNRRRFLAAAGGGLAVGSGGTGVAYVTRADIVFESDFQRGQGEPIVEEQTVTRDSVEYLASTDEVREPRRTLPFETWARSEASEVGLSAVILTIEERLETSVSVGTSVRGLLFGFVLSINHNIQKDRDGSVISEPDVAMDTLVSVAPRSGKVTVSIEDRDYSRRYPVAVSHGVVQEA